MHPLVKKHKLTKDGENMIKEVNQGFSAFLEFIDSYLPNKREKSIALTKIQEASFFASRAIVVDTQYQEK